VPVTLHATDVPGAPRVRIARPAVAGLAPAGAEEAVTRLADLLLAFRRERADSADGADSADEAGATEAPADVPLGDAGVLAGVLEPGALATARATVRVEVTGPRRGRVVADPSGCAVDLVVAVDGPALAARWLAAVGCRVGGAEGVGVRRAKDALP
jgi:hypothetical protein